MLLLSSPMTLYQLDFGLRFHTSLISPIILPKCKIYFLQIRKSCFWEGLIKCPDDRFSIIGCHILKKSLLYRI